MSPPCCSKLSPTKTKWTFSENLRGSLKLFAYSCFWCPNYFPKLSFRVFRRSSEMEQFLQTKSYSLAPQYWHNAFAFSERLYSVSVRLQRKNSRRRKLLHRKSRLRCLRLSRRRRNLLGGCIWMSAACIETSVGWKRHRAVGWAVSTSRHRSLNSEVSTVCSLLRFSENEITTKRVR